MKLGVAKEYFGEGLDAEVRKAVEAAIQKLAKYGMRDRSGFAAAHPYAIPPITWLRRRRLVEPGALRRRALRISRRKV